MRLMKLIQRLRRWFRQCDAGGTRHYWWPYLMAGQYRCARCGVIYPRRGTPPNWKQIDPPRGKIIPPQGGSGTARTRTLTARDPSLCGDPRCCDPRCNPDGLRGKRS
jgi:hypothetical protein